MPIVRITATIANEYANRCPEHIPERIAEGWNSVTAEELKAILQDAEYNSDPKAFNVGPDDMPLPVFNAYKALVKQIKGQITEDQVKVGCTFAAKKPRTVNPFAPLLDDRQVLYVDHVDGIVQYDSPTVRRGAKYPKVSMDAFLRWAGEDVTSKMPKGEWRRATPCVRNTEAAA